MTQITNEYFTERRGVIAFSRKVNALRWIWRETPNADIGIDGQVESVDDTGRCHGHIVAVQVKSGDSYVSRGSESEIHFYPTEKHRSYWRNFPLPVIVAVIASDEETIYWADARQQLRSPMSENPKRICLPRSRPLDEDTKQMLFASVGPIGGRILTIDEVVFDLARNRSNNAGFDMSFFELFALGSIDIGSKLFFSMSLCAEIAEYRASIHDMGIGCGGEEYAFLDRYVDYLVSQNLIHLDYGQYMIDRDDRELQPCFIAPLTERGLQVMSRLHRYNTGANVFYESCIGMAYPFQDQLPGRLRAMTQIQRTILSSPDPRG